MRRIKLYKKYSDFKFENFEGIIDVTQFDKYKWMVDSELEF